MEPIESAVAWVRAGGGHGAERDALVKALHSATLAAGVGEWVAPSGVGVATLEGALKLWKAKAHRTIAAVDRERGPGGYVLVERVPRLVTVTPGIAYRLDRGETVTITGATLVEVGHG